MGGVSMEWKEVKIGDLGQIITGKTPKTAIKKNWGGKIPFLSPSDDMSNKTSPVTARTLTELGVAEVAKCLIPANSICVSCIGSDLGKVVKTDRELVTNQQINTIVPHSNVDSDFVYYLMCIVGKELNYISKTSTAVPIINKSTFSDWNIVIPEKVEDQRRIASILSSLDRKIELNNKINADLEEMAQAIFKNWFVDFEPFKDDKFVDSELGMILEGWKVGTLGELCNFKRGKNLLTKNAIDEGVPVVAGGLEPSCYHNVANTGAPVITVSGSGANAGFMRMYHVPVWASDCSFIDVSCENFYFVYCFLKVNSKLLKHAQTGAVQPHVKPSDIHDFELVIPDKESIFDFQDKVKPFFDKIASIQKENSRLSLLRDTLLPRLMSGELEVPE